MPKISIIVPVYNVEEHLRKCLDSLVNQTLSDIEIICVDDGSTDSSLSILQEYAARDKRVRVFSQKNQGPSAARNLGLDNVQGEYLTFVDSDDWISNETCQKVYQKAVQTGTDAVLFGHSRIAANSIIPDGRLQNALDSAANEILNVDIDLENIIENIPVETFGKLYKSKFIKDAELKFPQSIRLGEDMSFFYSFCMLSPKISILNEPLYYYVINTANSLTKSPEAIKSLYRGFCGLKLYLKKSNLKHKEEFFRLYLKRISRTFIAYWNNCSTLARRSENFKYLKSVYDSYKKLPREEDDYVYKSLKDTVYRYRFEFIFKLFAPLIEFESRNMRFVIYLFERQVLNIPNFYMKRFKYNVYYSLNLWKLRFLSKFRKIRVGFWVTEPAKWSAQYLYNTLDSDKRFEPFILLSYFRTPQGNVPAKESYQDTKQFFIQNGCKVIETFDSEKYEFEPLGTFKPDIIFYQQPWLISENQRPEKVYKHSLLCYTPYCFYSMSSYMDYLANFHGILWKYFVETDLHKKEYGELYNASNCVTVGSTKFDAYHFINKESAEKCWKTKGKKRIIYAPHHTFNDGLLEVATFQKNGQFILELAKKHPETEWVFRPHPAFVDRLIKNSIMKAEEIDNYYNEWKKIGSISEGGNYYEMFASSDCLITDCISFLSEYAPTLNPVIYLRKDNQKQDFKEMTKKIIESYYQVYTNEELESIFENVILKGEDSLKEKRKNNVNLLPIDTLASKNIYNYLKKELWLK